MTQQRAFKPRPRKTRWKNAAYAQRLAEPEPHDLADSEPERREPADPGLATDTALLLAKISETLEEL
jgi:hypothetical protein